MTFLFPSALQPSSLLSCIYYGALPEFPRFATAFTFERYPRHATMARRQHLALTVVLALVVFFSISYLFTSSPTPDTAIYRPPVDNLGSSGDAQGFQLDLDAMPVGVLEGESIAPKLENATLKYVPLQVLS